jgi:hypothetical protein
MRRSPMEATRVTRQPGLLMSQARTAGAMAHRGQEPRSLPMR